MEIIELSGSFRDEAMDFIRKEWGVPIITKGNIIDVTALPGFAALHYGVFAGAALYRIKDGECEIVVLYSVIENIGAGAGLIQAVRVKAAESRCKRLWLITTNDNTPAIRYYQKRGFSFAALHRNAFLTTLKLKNEFGGYGQAGNGTIYGINGIPILHEIEFEIILGESDT